MDKARIVSYEKDNNVFEIYVDQDLALEIKEGDKDFESSYGSLLAIEEIYKDAKKGEKASSKAMSDSFPNLDVKEIVKEILIKGRLDLSTEQRRKIVEARKKELINYIVINSINPITKMPHTPTTVESSIEKVRIDVDINKPLSKQIDKIVEKLKAVLPMTFQTMKFRIHVPVSFSGKVNMIFNKYEVLERKWEPDGLVCLVQVPIGVKDSFLNSVSGLTQGQAKIELE